MLSTTACAGGISTVEEKYDTRDDYNITGKIVIDLNKKGQLIDRNFYGAHLDSHSPIPNKEYIDELQLGKLRIGGNEYDVFNWKTKRSVIRPEEFKSINGFEDIANSLQKLKVSGVFQINLTGFQPELIGDTEVVKRTFTSQAAYEMVKYLNGTLHLNIVDFSLGNEFSIWNETFSKIWPTGDGISADEYIDRYIEYALAIRRAQKEITGNPNSIKIWGPEISSSWLDWNTGNFSKDCEWTDVKGQVACSYGQGKFDHFVPYFLYKINLAEKDKKRNVEGFKLLDYFSIHYYPNFRTKIDDPLSIITDSKGLQRVVEMLESTQVFNVNNFTNKIDISSYRNFAPNILGRVQSWLNNYYPNAKIAMNEFAVDSDYRTDKYHPILRPLYMADSIGIFAKENVAFFNHFILNSDKSSDVPWSLLAGGTERKDAFFMYKLFSNYFKGVVLNVNNNLGNLVSSYATEEGNIINLAIVNKNPIDKKVKIYLKNFSEKKYINYLIPGWSASIIRIDKNANKNNNYTVYQFGAKEMGIAKDPAYAK